MTIQTALVLSSCFSHPARRPWLLRFLLLLTSTVSLGMYICIPFHHYHSAPPTSSLFQLSPLPPPASPPTPPSPPFPNLSASSFTLYLSSSHSSACLSPQDADWPALVQGCPPFSWFVPSPCFVTTDKDLEQVSVTNVADLAPAHFGTSVTPKKFDYTARAHAH